MKVARSIWRENHFPFPKPVANFNGAQINAACKLPASLKVGFSKVCPSPEFEKLCYKAAFTFYVPTICIRVLVIPPGVKRPHSAEIFHRFFCPAPRSFYKFQISHTCQFHFRWRVKLDLLPWKPKGGSESRSQSFFKAPASSLHIYTIERRAKLIAKANTVNLPTFLGYTFGVFSIREIQKTCVTP